jgi:predicted exporter
MLPEKRITLPFFLPFPLLILRRSPKIRKGSLWAKAQAGVANQFFRQHAIMTPEVRDMAQQQIYEGTPDELAHYLAQRPKQRFRLVALADEDQEPTPAPNEEVLAMLREIAIMKAGMAPMDGAETDRLLRQARAGAMYSDDSDL